VVISSAASGPPPPKFPVVLLFSGKSGVQYDYRDGWTGEGVFRYTGEGQRGDMTFDEGNKAIRDDRVDHKDLLLFEDLGKGKGVRFEGVFECMGWSMVDGQSKRGEARKVIVFDLVRVAAATSASSPPSLSPHVTDGFKGKRLASLPELRQKAYDA
jgi:5-methylcytosine-specific restriction enzyme A